MVFDQADFGGGAAHVKRQNLLFSATYPQTVQRLADGLLVRPVQIQVTRSNTAVDSVTQVVHPCAKARKMELVAHIINKDDLNQVLIFAKTKQSVNDLTDYLKGEGISSVALHGNKTQGARRRALEDFKKIKVRVLVATDIAARGLDIDTLPYVINYELPGVSEDYVHRIGRSGRAGNTGKAITLVCADEHKHLRDIERFLNRPIPVKEIGDFKRGDAISFSKNKNSASSANDRSFGDSDKRGGKERRVAGKPKSKTSSRQGDFFGEKSSTKRSSSKPKKSQKKHRRR
ncbi:MAG: hypothetical protein HRT88_15680 [Lentisphaeraceae bacterium]|nr:hypothetical protein [Lentisphaeraceae bacterium]